MRLAAALSAGGTTAATIMLAVPVRDADPAPFAATMARILGHCES